jgi:transposase
MKLVLELKRETLDNLLERVQPLLPDEEYVQIKGVFDTLAYVTQLLENDKTTIQRLRRILFGATTEKFRKVFKKDVDNEATPPEKDGGGLSPTAHGAAEKKGHGRHGAQAYSGAEKVVVNHASLVPYECCPECQKGKLYETTRPGVLVRVIGRAPLGATVYELQKLRCNLCGEVFTAKAPEGLGAQKYDEGAASMVALLKYGSGFPFHRLEQLQDNLGLPLPASTQWDIAEKLRRVASPAFNELVRQGAQSGTFYNDDTTMKVLELMGRRAPSETLAQEAGEPGPERTGVFTSSIVCTTREGHSIALYFTGRKHAGENLADLLAHRAKDLSAPIQMCDALSRNLPGELKTIVANCIAHGRRKFVDVVNNFPEECRHVLEILREVYRNDAHCRNEGLSPDDRLAFHQTYSGPPMTALESWLTEQFETHQVEPNSGLGRAISYMRNHWSKLTLFLRQAGAPLDNNIVERALKKAILHRKGSLFYRTQHGAHVGDLFMSLIHTCQLCGANAYDYLTTLQKHFTELSSHPEQWMPWNYRQTLQGLGPS